MYKGKNSMNHGTQNNDEILDKLRKDFFPNEGSKEKLREILDNINMKVIGIVGGLPIVSELIGKYIDNKEKGFTQLFEDTGDLFEIGLVSAISLGVSYYVSTILKQKKDVQEGLEEELDFIQEIMDSIPYPVYYKNSNQEYIICNDMFCFMVGLDKKNILGKNDKEIFEPSFYNTIQEISDQGTFKSKKRTKVYEGKFPNFNGDVEIYYTPYLHRNGEKGIIGTIVDITEYKNKIKLQESVNRILNHELKTPLNGIISIPKILLESEDGETLSENQKELVQFIENCGIDMLNQINQSMDLLKLEEGKYVLHQELFNFNDMFNEIINIFELSFGKGCFEIKNLGSKDTNIGYKHGMNVNNLTMLGDKKILHHLFQNAFKNALESNDIKKGKVVISYFEDSEGYHFIIENNKMIPLSIQKNFFDKLITHGKCNGTGYGTYIMKLITELHGGNIHFTTKEGETKLFIDLPANIDL